MRTQELADSQEKLWLAMIGISILCHTLAILIIMYGPRLSLNRHKPPPVMNLDLVGFSAPAPPPRAQAPEIRTKAPLKQEKKTDLPIAEPPSEEPRVSPEKSPAPGKMRVKRSLKKKTFKAAKVKKSKLDQLKKDVDSRPDSVERAIASLRDTVTERPATALPPGLPAVGQGTADSPATSPEEIYGFELQYHVKKNWLFPSYLAEGQKNLSATVLITVERDGTISDVMFDQRSGNSYFDDTVERAIAKSSPVPPFPEAITEKNQMFVIEFKH